MTKTVRISEQQLKKIVKHLVSEMRRPRMSDIDLSQTEMEPEETVQSVDEPVEQCVSCSVESTYPGSIDPVTGLCPVCAIDQQIAGMYTDDTYDTY